MRRPRSNEVFFSSTLSVVEFRGSARRIRRRLSPDVRKCRRLENNEDPPLRYALIKLPKSGLESTTR